MRVIKNSSARVALRLGLGAGALLAATACDYDGEFLFADVADVAPILHIEGEGEGGHVVPVAAESLDDVRANTIYAEVGAPRSAEPGGVTFTFEGTGGDVCVWVDPELAFWNQKIGLAGNPQGNPWSYPDNIYDDGDLDLYVGLSAYYTGSPGEEMGDFVVSYEDSLGNEVPIELVACSNRGYTGDLGAHAGRGTAEYCSVGSTSLGISYTVAMHTFAAPLDDDRLGFGVFVFEGSCNDLKTLAGAGGIPGEECVIQGEAIAPTEGEAVPWVGFDEGRAWGGSVDFESAFCSTDIVDYCEDELDAVYDAGSRCSWDDAATDGGTRCFCGDPSTTPRVGG